MSINSKGGLVLYAFGAARSKVYNGDVHFMFCATQNWTWCKLCSPFKFLALCIVFLSTSVHVYHVHLIIQVIFHVISNLFFVVPVPSIFSYASDWVHFF